MLKFLVVLAVFPSLLLAGRIQLINLDPEEAQKYITQQSLDLKYAKKLGQFPLGRGLGRNLEAPEQQQFYHNGKLIDNPEDYVEDVYEASQFHGQDGLGRTMFGYTDHNQARLEARNANGEVRGSYQYVDPNGEEIVVQYWSDALGFHQTDNRVIIMPEPVTDTPEVREARRAHLAAWEEAANYARAHPDPDSDLYNRNNVDEAEDDEPVGALSNQHQSLTRYPSLPYDHHISPNNKRVNGLVLPDSVLVEAAEESRQNLQYQKSIRKRQSVETATIQEEEFTEVPDSVEEETEADKTTTTTTTTAKSVGRSGKQYVEDETPSDPKGFFYSFDYPVSIILENQAKRSVKLTPEASEINPTVIKDLDDRVSLKAVKNGETLAAAVHDAQVSPKQKHALI